MCVELPRWPVGVLRSAKAVCEIRIEDGVDLLGEDRVQSIRA